MFIEGCGYYSCNCGTVHQVLVPVLGENNEQMRDEEDKLMWQTDWDASAELMYAHVNVCPLINPQEEETVEEETINEELVDNSK